MEQGGGGWMAMDWTGRYGTPGEAEHGKRQETVGEDSERYRNKDPRPKAQDPRVLTLLLSRHLLDLLSSDAKTRR